MIELTLAITIVVVGALVMGALRLFRWLGK